MQAHVVGIREVDERDAAVVAEFLLAMVYEMASSGGHSVAERAAAFAWIRERITTALGEPEHLLLLAEPGGSGSVPLGVIEASIAQPDPVFEVKRILHIHAVYVESAHRRQGIGRQLIEAALHWARQQGCVEAELNALVGNPARHLYESLGFRAFEIEMRRSL